MSISLCKYSLTFFLILYSCICWHSFVDRVAQGTCTYSMANVGLTGEYRWAMKMESLFEKQLLHVSKIYSSLYKLVFGNLLHRGAYFVKSITLVNNSGQISVLVHQKHTEWVGAIQLCSWLSKMNLWSKNLKKKSSPKPVSRNKESDVIFRFSRVFSLKLANFVKFVQKMGYAFFCF